MFRIDGVPLVDIKQSFIPSELFDVLEHGAGPWPGISEASIAYGKVVAGLTHFHDITPDIYWYIYKLLLYLEHHQTIWDMKKYQLYDQKIVLSQKRRNELIIRVPGLEEERPSVRVHDFVDLIQVDGPNNSSCEVTYVARDYVAVKATERFYQRFQNNHLYDVQFRCSDWTINCLNYVLNDIHKYRLAPLLFPEFNGNHEFVDCDEKPLEWINPSIVTNPEQQQAVKNILKKTSLPAPYILFGPPGTGKTSTLVESICQIIKKNPTGRILICTPSNAAADEISMRLLKNSIPENSLYRMYSSSRNIDDVNDIIKPFSNMTDTQSIYLSREVFATKKIVISTLSTSIRLYNYRLLENHFSYLFIDEAGQATELETLIPLLLICSKDTENASKYYGQIVIAGDPKQLGPMIRSKLAESLLSKSMLERLMGWGPYKKKNDNKYDPMFVTKLVQNYRCHETILRLPNELFYDGELVAKGGYHTMKALNWSGLPKKKFPIIFHAVKSNEGRDMYSPSVYNLGEVKAIVNYVKKLLNSKRDGMCVRQEDIGVITPYKLQRIKIHEALECENLSNITVGTVEVFQGQERDIIIISTVRSVLYRNGERIHVGFLSNPKRFNVAITRAKSLLIVVGNPEILEYDVHWRAFIEYCVVNKACTGDMFDLTMTKSDAKIHKLLGQKHIVIPCASPQTPLVEDPTDEADNNSIESDETRRRRIPIGPHVFDGNSSRANSSLDNSECDYNEEYWTKVDNIRDGEDLCDFESDGETVDSASETPSLKSCNGFSSDSNVDVDHLDGIMMQLRGMMSKFSL